MPARRRNRLYEDRISMMLDDGTVEDFANIGGWTTVYEGMRTLTSEADSAEVSAHPRLGGDMGRSDVRKYLALSRDSADERDSAWQDVRDDGELERLHGDHPGSEALRTGNIGVRDFHDIEQLQEFIIGHEKQLADDENSD